MTFYMTAGIKGLRPIFLSGHSEISRKRCEVLSDSIWFLRYCKMPRKHLPVQSQNKNYRQRCKMFQVNDKGTRTTHENLTQKSNSIGFEHL